MGNKFWKSTDEKSYENFVTEYLPVQRDEGGYEYRDMVFAAKENDLMLERYLAEQYDMDVFEKHTALVKAAEEGHLGVVRDFVEQHNVDVRFLNRALIKAADNDHLEVIRYPVECGAIINPNTGYDLLLKSVMKGKYEIVQFLVEKCNIDVNTRNSCRETALLKAAAAGYVDVVRYLAGVGADLMATNVFGCNALMEAASSGKLDVVQYLTEGAVDVNATDIYGYTAIMRAVKSGHIDIVRHLANQNASMNIADNKGVTALMWAAGGGHTDIIRCIVKYNVDVNATSKNGDTALMWAVEGGYLDTVQILTEYGIDLNITDSAGRTALIKATLLQRDDIVQFLVISGADTNIRDERGYTALLRATEENCMGIVRCVVEYGHADVNAMDIRRETALMKAVRNNHVDVARYLVQQGTNVNAANEHGSTALMLALKWNDIDLMHCIANQWGADVNIINIYGSTTLMLAAERGFTEIIRYLVGECGAEVNVRDGNGDTALMLAAKEGHSKVVRYLVGRGGTDMNIRDGNGNTALMLAAKEGYTDVVRCLAESHDAIVNAKNNDKTTALIWATERGHLGIVRVLVEKHGADINIADNEGNTALMKAVMSKRIDLVQYLVSRNANVGVINNRGETAFRLAYNYGYQTIQRILLPFLSLTPIQNDDATRNTTSSPERSCYLIPPNEVALIDQCQDGNIVGKEYHAKWLDADVVVKLYIPDASIEEEVYLWQKLRHPNVLKIYGACTAGSSLQFFVYEYTSKGSLIEVRRASVRKLSTGWRRGEVNSATWRHLHGAALGLEYLHERGVIHGDLRCSNILIGDDGLAKLSNFRLRGSMDKSDIMPSSMMGSIRWQSPEVVKGEQPSSASDVYSLGMCILEAATANVPWHRQDEEWVLKYKAGNNRCTYCGPDCPPGDAYALALRMGCQDPNDRPSLFSIVFELERLSMKNSNGPEVENLNFFTGYKLDKLSEAWRKVRTHMETCDNEEYCRVFDELTSVCKYLKSSTLPTLLAKFYALLTEFYQIIKMSPEEARIVRLSSSRATTTSFYAMHWRIEVLLKTLQGSTDTLTWRNEQWQQQRDDQTKLFVSGVSDAYLLLKDLKTVEERSAFLNVLKTEMENFQSKYTADQLETMKTTYDTIVSKIGTDDLLSLTPEWFIPWYELIIDEWSELGKGGFGSVCRGKWLDSDVVVKQVLLIGDSQDSSDFSNHSLSADASSTEESNMGRTEALVMFRREVEIWFGLSHPHVIRLFGACHVGRPFFVCEYATNGTMIDYLRKHPDQLWTVLLGAALGVQYLHAHGVVHGDLKGNNIVIGSDKKAKVTDFGLSSITKNENDTPQVSAALHWVAPECFSDANANSAAQAKMGPTFESDVYSLGMCIVEALRVVENVEAVKRGEEPQPCLPWGGLDNVVVRYHAKQGVLPRKPTICKGGPWALVKRMCVFEPQKRIKISTVVDEIAMLVAGIDQHIDSSSKVHGWRQKLTKIPIVRRQSVNLHSVSKIIAKTQKQLAKWRYMIIRSGLEFSIYSSLWEHFEHVHGQINDSHSAKCQGIYCSLVAEANEATLKLKKVTSRLKKAKPDVSFLTKATMRCYELERRLEKFCEAYFLVYKP